MKIILLEDVVNLGKKNQIIEVNDGYAKNFLFKKKLAVAYTKSSLNKLNLDLKHIEEEHELEVYEANLLKQKIENMNLNFKLHANHGKAFGTISVKQLIDEINKQEKIVTKYMFYEKEWGLGPHNIEIHIIKEVTAILKINVLEQE